MADYSSSGQYYYANPQNRGRASIIDYKPSQSLAQFVDARNKFRFQDAANKEAGKAAEAKRLSELKAPTNAYTNVLNPLTSKAQQAYTNLNNAGLQAVASGQNPTNNPDYLKAMEEYNAVNQQNANLVDAYGKVTGKQFFAKNKDGSYVLGADNKPKIFANPTEHFADYADGQSFVQNYSNEELTKEIKVPTNKVSYNGREIEGVDMTKFTEDLIVGNDNEAINKQFQNKFGTDRNISEYTKYIQQSNATTQKNYLGEDVKFHTTAPNYTVNKDALRKSVDGLLLGNRNGLEKLKSNEDLKPYINQYEEIEKLDDSPLKSELLKNKLSEIYKLKSYSKVSDEVYNAELSNVEKAKDYVKGLSDSVYNKNTTTTSFDPLERAMKDANLKGAKLENKAKAEDAKPFISTPVVYNTQGGQRANITNAEGVVTQTVKNNVTQYSASTITTKPNQEFVLNGVGVYDNDGAPTDKNIAYSAKNMAMSTVKVIRTPDGGYTTIPQDLIDQLEKGKSVKLRKGRVVKPEDLIVTIAAKTTDAESTSTTTNTNGVSETVTSKNNGINAYGGAVFANLPIEKAVEFAPNKKSNPNEYKMYIKQVTDHYIPNYNSYSPSVQKQIISDLEKQ